MLKLKTVSLLKHRSDLSILPEGKLLINTINAHSYNTALKDAEFAEALLKGGALIPDGASMVLAFRWLRKESIERTAGWDLFEYEMERLPTLQTGIYRRRKSNDDRCHKCGKAGLIVDRHDGSQTREMGVYASGCTGGERTYRNYRSGIRLLCGYG